MFISYDNKIYDGRPSYLNQEIPKWKKHHFSYMKEIKV